MSLIKRGTRGSKCCYNKCTSYKRTGFTEITFFQFPSKEPERAKQWQMNSGNSDIATLPLSELKWRVMCDKHFANNYVIRGKRKILFRNAIPDPYVEEDVQLRQPMKTYSNKKSKESNVEDLWETSSNSSNIEEYQNWLAAVDGKLKEKAFSKKSLHVCQDHFESSCFLKNSIKIIKDGKEVSLPRQRLILNSKSVPSIFPSTTKQATEVCPQTTNATETDAPKASFRLVKIPQTTPSSDGNEECASDSPKLTLVAAPSPFDTAPSPLDAAPSPLDAVPSSIDAVPSSIDAETGKCTLEQLKQDWNSCQEKPNYWGLVESTSGIIFAYCGDTLNTITRTILVKDDMSTEVRANGHIAKYPVFEKVKHLQDILAAMFTLGCLWLCANSNVKDHCPNGFFMKVPKSKVNKCKVCQLENRRLLCQELKRKHRLIERMQKKSKFIKNLMAKYKKAVKKSSEEIEMYIDAIE